MKGSGRMRRLAEPGYSGAAIAPAPTLTAQGDGSPSAAVATPGIAVPSATARVNADRVMRAGNAEPAALFRGPAWGGAASTPPRARFLHAREQLGQPDLQGVRDLVE